MVTIRIKEARQHYEQKTGNKLTIKRLAEIIMYDQPSQLPAKVDLLYKMQRGAITHPRLELIERIAAVCGVDFNFLLRSEMTSFIQS